MQIGRHDTPLFTTLRDEPSFFAFLLQQLGVPLVCFVAVLSTSQVPGIFKQSGVDGESAGALWALVGALVSGFVLGCLASRFMPRATSTGRWIWIIPSLFFLWAFLDESLSSSLVSALRMLFFPGPNGAAGLVLVLLTVPTISTWSYSAAMGWRAYTRRRDGTDLAAHR
jgi:hypothetical protein